MLLPAHKRCWILAVDVQSDAAGLSAVSHTAALWSALLQVAPPSVVLVDRTVRSAAVKSIRPSAAVVPAAYKVSGLPGPSRCRSRPVSSLIFRTCDHGLPRAASYTLRAPDSRPTNVPALPHTAHPGSSDESRFARCGASPPAPSSSRSSRRRATCTHHTPQEELCRLFGSPVPTHTRRVRRRNRDVAISHALFIEYRLPRRALLFRVSTRPRCRAHDTCSDCSPPPRNRRCARPIVAGPIRENSRFLNYRWDLGWSPGGASALMDKRTKNHRTSQNRPQKFRYASFSSP